MYIVSEKFGSILFWLVIKQSKRPLLWTPADLHMSLKESTAVPHFGDDFALIKCKVNLPIFIHESLLY